MNEFPENLWAPWRMQYIRSISDQSKSGCFLCDDRDAPQDDSVNHVVCRSDHALLVMNRFPYTNGHLLVAPLGHKADLEDLSDAEMNGLWCLTRDAKVLLTDTLNPHGFNIGINFGLCAGAGLPGHLHVHIVPRWNGDTNFMAVLGDVRVIPESLDRLYEELVAAATELGLPRPPRGATT
jgi:ATP adenylyltransferase